MATSTMLTVDREAVEYYTPKWITALGKLSLPGKRIDLDPASNQVANEGVERLFGVGAERIYTVRDNGLEQPWEALSGWLNHPFGVAEDICRPNCKLKRCKDRAKAHNKAHSLTGADALEYLHRTDERLPGNDDWVHKAVVETKSGQLGALVGICYASTSEQWFQKLMHNARIMCFLSGRVHYYRPEIDPETGETVYKLAAQAQKGSVIYGMGRELELPQFWSTWAAFGSVWVPGTGRLGSRNASAYHEHNMSDEVRSVLARLNPEVMPKVKTHKRQPAWAAEARSDGKPQQRSLI